MEILKTKVFWNQAFENDARLQILVDRIPQREELIYRKSGSHYLAVLDGYASYYYWRGPDNTNGFYGAEFPIKLQEGEDVNEVILKGPWSSRAGAVNRSFKEQIVQVSMTEQPTSFDKGSTFMSGAITLAKAVEASEMIYAYMVVEDENLDGNPGDLTYIVSSHPYKLMKPVTEDLDPRDREYVEGWNKRHDNNERYRIRKVNI